MLTLIQTMLVCWPTMVALQAEQPPTIDGVPLIKWNDAAKYYEREVIVYGQIVLTRSIGSFAFLNFHTDYRNNFTVLIRGQDFKAFPKPPETMYKDKYIAARGKVVQYRDKPEIIVTSPSEIVILPQDPEDIVAALKENVPKRPPAVAADAAVGNVAANTITGKLTVATANLRQTLDSDAGFCSAGREGGGPAGSGFQQAAEIIKSFDAGIVAVQWGGSMKCLNRFNRELLSDLGYTHVIGHSDARGKVDCALLSRYPASRSRSMMQFKDRKGKSMTYHRLPLRAEVRLSASETLTLLVVSMPSRADKMKTRQINAEAKAIHQLIDEQIKHRSDGGVLVLGGFGGSLSSKAVGMVLGKGEQALAIPGYTPTTKKNEPQPTIAQVENFILANKWAQERYVAGSTKLPQGKPFSDAVALSLEVSEPKPTDPPNPRSKPAQSPAAEGF